MARQLKILIVYLYFAVLSINFVASVKTANNKNIVVDDISDQKELKKLFRTKTNVLVMFVSNAKEAQPYIKVFREAAEIVKGVGTMILLDCSLNDKKKLCKKMKVTPAPYNLKHYKDGEFHKDYDRRMTVSSMVNFMRDPTGELPWEEDPDGGDILHIPDYTTFTKFLKKEAKPILVMFYVRWCGYCKRLKPDYAAAATELKGHSILVAMDVERAENAMARKVYNITGFPTILYFESGKMKLQYEGDNNKAAIVAFMENPTAPPPIKAKDEDWSADTTSEIVHLTTKGFEPAIKDEKSVLIMFYAPWCGHCKQMKPEYEKAAIQMKEEKVPGILAALDATKEGAIAQKFGVKGYPTVKYFINGEFQFDVNIREADEIVDFMRDPKEPPPPPPPEKPWEEEENTEVVHLNEENFKSFLKKKKHALVMFYAPWCGHCKNAKPEFSAAANHFKDDPRVALAAVDCTSHTSVCSAQKVRGYPKIIYFSYLKTRIDYTGGRNEKDFIAFLKNPTDDSSSSSTIEKKTDAFGTFPGSQNLLILTDNNFEKELRNFQRLLILFYAPWCGHCKAMKPDFAAAAAKMPPSSDPNYRLAAIDCDANAKVCENYDIAGYPTIILFENGKKLSNYDGPRKTNDMLRFLRESDANSLKDEL